MYVVLSKMFALANIVIAYDSDLVCYNLHGASSPMHIIGSRLMSRLVILGHEQELLNTEA